MYYENPACLISARSAPKEETFDPTDLMFDVRCSSGHGGQLAVYSENPACLISARSAPKVEDF